MSHYWQTKQSEWKKLNFTLDNIEIWTLNKLEDLFNDIMEDQSNEGDGENEGDEKDDEKISKGKDYFGIKSLPLWTEVEPKFYVTPLLHAQIK